MENLIIQFLIPLAGAAIGAWFSTYVKKKAENKAIREDLEELTEIAKRTEKKFTDETEKLKAQLSLFNQLEFDLKSEERKALIEFHKKVWVHFSYLTDTNMGIVNFEKEKSFEKSSEFCHKQSVELENTFRLCELFILPENKEILTLIRAIISDFIKHELQFIAHINLHEKNLIKNEKDNYELFYAESDKIIEKYSVFCGRLMQNTQPKLERLTDLLREYLRKQSSK